MAGALEVGEMTIASAPRPPPPSGVICLFDGALDADALAERLGADPARAPEALVAAGYARLGAGVVGLLDGPFALVVWDRHRRRGLIARDCTGGRPLFTAEHGGALLFGSEVRNLVAALPARPAPDAGALAAWLARAPLVDDRTLFGGVRRVAPAHLVEFEDGRWRQRRYWRPAYVAPRVTDFDEAARAVRDALAESVAAAVRDARRPALLLSGGLDSAAVAAAGAPAIQASYSGVFPSHPEVDETRRLRRVRDAVGLTGVEAQLGTGSALGGAIEFIRAWELPSLSPNRFVWASLYRRAAADGVDVLLTGDGGDELFGCAPFLIADRLRGGRVRSAVTLARRLPGMGEHPQRRWLVRALLVYGVRGALPHGLHERLRRARGRDRGPNWLARPAPVDRWAWKRAPGPRWWAQLAHMLTADALGASEQNSREAAMHGLAFRHPLRDRRLVGLVLSLAPELSYHPHLDRPLARRALAGDLPADVLADVRKPAFNPLLEDALRGPDHPLLRDLLGAPRPDLARQVHIAEVAALPRRLRAGGSPPALALDAWRIASAELWLRHLAGADLRATAAVTRPGATDPP